MKKETENILRKIAVIFCIWLTIISTVFLLIGIHVFIADPTTTHGIYIIIETIVVCLCATIIYLCSSSNYRRE